MNPVVGLDVAKGESQIQGYLDKKKRGIHLLNLRNLTRQHDNITSICVQTKLQFQSELDQVFPEYRGVFGDLYSTVSLLTLLSYPTSKDVLETDKEILDNSIHEFCPRRSLKWAASKAEKLIEAALRDPFQETLYQSNILTIEMYINMLMEY